MHINHAAQRAFAEINPEITAGGRALYWVLSEGLRYASGLTDIPDAAKKLGMERDRLRRFFKGLKKGCPWTFHAWAAADPCLMEAWCLHRENTPPPASAVLAEVSLPDGLLTEREVIEIMVELERLTSAQPDLMEELERLMRDQPDPALNMETSP